MISGVATIETRLALVERDVRALAALIGGGDGVAWEQSIRGRLHKMQETLSTADALSEALREVRRERAKRWSKGERLALFGFATVGALAAIIGAVAALVPLLSP